MPKLTETVDTSEALAVVMRKREEARTGKAVPIEAFVCRACGSLFGDRETTKLLHGKKQACCEGDRITAVDANTIRFNEDGEIVAAVHLE